MENNNDVVEISINENILVRLDSIVDAANKYGLFPNIKDSINVYSNENQTKISIEIKVEKVFFQQECDFFMKIFEDMYSFEGAEDITIISSYSYQGMYRDNTKEDYLRFDFEPHKKNYYPIHINCNKDKWGDHLVFPDSTNLDISKMNIGIALKIFKRYSNDRLDFPTNSETNEAYVKMFEGAN